MRKSLILILILLTLACNFPGFSAIRNRGETVEPSPEVSPESGDTDPQPDEPKQDGDADTGGGDAAAPTSTFTPTATATDTPSSVDDPTATLTPTPTETPSPTATETPTPTATKKPAATATRTSTPTPTSTLPPQPGPPMSFLDPAWELVEWHKLGDTGEWEGTLRARITGGTPPYRSKFEVNDFVDGLDMTVRWRLCKPLPATIRVVSADGQDIHKAIWVWEVGCD